MTTDWNLWKTGLMAIDGSIQLREQRWRNGKTDYWKVKKLPQKLFNLGGLLWYRLTFNIKGQHNKSTPPEVQHRVGNRWSSVFKRLNDDCKTFMQREYKCLKLKKIGHLQHKSSCSKVPILTKAAAGVPWLYVLTRVAKLAMSVTAEKSAMSAISSVRSNDCSRSAQNLEPEWD